MRTRPKPPTVPGDRHDTLRHQISSLLSEESLTAREISERIGLQEKEVLEHLEHIRIGIRGRMVVTPPTCLECGFAFRKRERLKAPGRCPVCRSERISQPQFSIG